MRQDTYKVSIQTAVSQLQSDKQITTIREHFDAGQRRTFKVEFMNKSWAMRVPFFCPPCFARRHFPIHQSPFIT